MIHLPARFHPVAVALVGAVLLVPYFVIGGDTLAGGIYWDVAVALMLLGAAARARRTSRRLAWGLMLAGQFAFLIGDVTWLVLEHGFESGAYPNVGDLAYLSGYVLLAAGAFALVPTGRVVANVGALVDGLVVAVASGVLLWVFVMGPLAEDQSVSTAARLVSTAYPAGDLLLIALGSQLLLRLRWSTPAAILMGSLGALLAGDVWYLLLTASDGYTAGHPVDGLWFAGYVLFAAVAWHPAIDDVVATSDDDAGVGLGRIAFLAAV